MKIYAVRPSLLVVLVMLSVGISKSSVAKAPTLHSPILLGENPGGGDPEPPPPCCSLVAVH